ncbi:MAG: T9SS type A sorting domain-containing protein [Candidatus Cloacimonetes bacterium]|nr:T9SS type A sorting domain-containing protein [Candidatus Cloacimonadota bacterium]
MKKTGAILFILLLIGLMYAGEIAFEKSFDMPQVVDNEMYLQIEYDNCMWFGAEGEPLVPWMGVDLLLPQNEQLTGVNILDIEYYSEISTGIIQPAGRPFPISQPAPANYLPEPDAAIYGTDAVFPLSSLSEYGTGFLCGHSIGTFSICPLEYNPVRNTVRYIKSISIKLETSAVERSGELNARLRGNEEVLNRLERIVDNPEAVGTYNYTTQRLSDYDLLLITSSGLADDFAEYVEFKESTGYSVAVETTDDIYNEYTGVDDAEKVRNCIIDYYLTYGIDYVILGGDAGNTNETAIVPHRGFAVSDDPSLPSDMYFSNLDGNWNDDGDGNWGEYGEIDEYAELAIGRMCVDSASEVAIEIEKHILYQNTPVEEDIEKSVMVGEELNNSPQTNGGDYKDQIVDGGYHDGYSTTGISANFNVNYFYERDTNWSKYDLMDEFSDTGINLLNHLGHSSPTYNMKMENSDLTEANFTNNGITRGFTIGYSQGCYNGSFDNWHYNGYYVGEDCFAEKITGGISGGYVACIANSRYGWYMPGGTNSSSQYYDRIFFDGIFGEGLSKIGEVNQYSHEDDVSYMLNDSNMRWACYETNLFGDPSLDIWTAIPEDIVATVPPSVSIGVSQISIQTNVNNARVAILQNGELLGRGMTGFNGLLNLNLEEAITSPAPLDISIIAHNYNRYEGIIIVVSDQPYVVYQGYTLDDSAGNNNDLPDYGEEISLDLELYNVGNQNAVNTEVTVSTDNEYITMLDDSEIIGVINAESIIELTDAISFAISDAIPDQELVNFTVTVTGDGREEWVSYFQITINAPALVYGGISIDDSIIGDNDGILDPGETAEITLLILNNGQSDSPFASLQLSCDNAEINLQIQNVDLGIIAANGELEGVFPVTVGTNIEIGTPVEFTLVCQADNYTILEEFVEPVGLIVEDFESGNFESYDWTFSGNSDWGINTLAYEGSYSAKSGNINDNQSSSILLDLNVLFNGQISFSYKVSSEGGYDFLKFYIDGSEVGAWSGELPWAQATFDISQGEHSIQWSFTKDGYVSSGSDCAWIDYIIFPAIGIPDPAEMVLDAEELSFILEEGETGYANLELANEGEENLIWNVSKHYLDSRDSGGPDNYGYMWLDSNEAGAVEFDWIDITGTGNSVSFTHNDEGTALLPMGFTFNFYGADYNEFLINPNGWIGFGADSDEWSNTSLPESDAPRPAIMPFWDDLYPAIGGNGGGTVYYQSFTDYLVVMFNDVIHYPGDYNGTYDFEVIIWENGDIKMQYNSLDGDLDTCTIGIQNAQASDALQVIYNDDYLEEELAIYIHKVVNWLDISSTSGEIMMNDQQNLQFTAHTDELEAGEYVCELIFNTNDPLQETVIIPVTLTIGMGVIYGDVDSSLLVDAFDASCVLQYIVGLDPLPELDPLPWEAERMEAADVDNSNNLEAYDGSLILQYVVGVISEFPAQNGDPVNVPEAGIRMDCLNDAGQYFLRLISEGDIYSLTMTAQAMENVNLGEPELLEPENTMLAWNDEDDWILSCCNAYNFSNDIVIVRIPVALNEESGEEAFLLQINTADWVEYTFDFSTVDQNINEIIYANQLLGNYPNPFNPETTLAFTVKDDNTPVKISIYNVKGQLVQVLTNEAYSSGEYLLTWDAAGLASGVYFYRCQMADYVSTQKMLLMK